jgi:hypothetical protein
MEKGNLNVSSDFILEDKPQRRRSIANPGGEGELRMNGWKSKSLKKRGGMFMRKKSLRGDSMKRVTMGRVELSIVLEIGRAHV